MTENDSPCTGACCAKFWLPYDLETYWKAYRAWLLKQERLLPFENNADYEDIQKIAPMLQYLGPNDDATGGHWYTCKHWDTLSGLCQIYAARPKMCADFPYQEPCVHCGWENKEYIEAKKERDKKVLPAGGVGFKNGPN